MIFELEIPGLPPTVNTLFSNSPRGRIKTKDYRNFEMDVFILCMKRGDIPLLKGMKMRPYTLTLQFIAPEWFYPTSGEPKKPDTPNMIKGIEDAICAVYAWKDAYNFRTVAEKITAPGPTRTRIIFDFSR